MANTQPTSKNTPARLRQHLPILVALLLLGFGVRMVGIDSQPLSGDEAYSVVVWVGSTVEQLMTEIAVATTEPHPPLALLSLHGWAQLTGDSIAALRTFSVLPTMVVMAAAYAIAVRLGDPTAGLIAVGLLAVNPFQLWYGQFARNYALWMGLSAVTLWLLIRTWRGSPRRYLSWVPYIGLAALTGYVFYLEAFMFVGHNLIALAAVLRDRRALPTWIGVQLTLAVILAPWWLRPELFTNSQEYVPNGHPAHPLWALQAFLMGDTLPFPLQPEGFAQTGAIGVMMVLAALLIIGALDAVRLTRDRETTIALAVPALLPVLLLTLLSLVTTRDYFHPRYVAASAMPAVLLLAFGLTSLPRLDGWPRRTALRVAGGAAAVVLGLSLFAVGHYHANPEFARGPDWPQVMALLDEQVSDGDLIIRNTPDPAFDYYYRHMFEGAAAWQVLPEERGTPPSETAARLEALAGQHEVMWFLPVPQSAWDPDKQVLAWLQTERQYISDQWIGPTRIYQFADWQAAPERIAEPVGAEFAGVAVLEGYRVTPAVEDWQPGITVYVELFWRPLSRTDEIVHVFVHLWGPPQPDGNIIYAQDDQMPQGGRASMEVWDPGSLIRDTYALQLPEAMPPAVYQVAVGAYSITTGERYPLTNGADHVILLETPLSTE